MTDPLTEDKELLFRQIHPDLLDGDVPASSNFKPKKSDENKLSLDRATLTTAAGAFERYTAAGRNSVAVYALSVSEFGSESVPCFSDPIKASAAEKENPAHCIAHFGKHGSNQQDKIAKRLKQKAISRGKQHP